MNGHHKQSRAPTTALSTVNTRHLKAPQSPFYVCKCKVVTGSGKNSHGKNNTFLQSDWSTLTRLLKVLLYSCGDQEEQWWEARSQEKHAEKDNCSSELTQDASLPFQ